LHHTAISGDKFIYAINSSLKFRNTRSYIPKLTPVIIVSEIDMYSRLIRSRLLEAQQDTAVTLLAGPRQAGKTTLVKQISVEQE
jgi:predicted AAA+ superfamily ATPase